MQEKESQGVKELLHFIQKSPTAFHAIENLSTILTEKGYSCLSETTPENLIPGGKYYITRNQSSLLAFRIPKEKPHSFMIAASHSDSPLFKIKNQGEITACGKYTKLNVERYGGMILSSWFDRPLSVAGRIVIREKDRFISKNVQIDQDLAIIPNVCIHFNRQINDGYRYNPQIDLLPLIGDIQEQGKLAQMIAQVAGTTTDQVVSSDLFLYNRTPACTFGIGNEYFAAPRIDNLECAFETFNGFIDSTESEGVIPVYAVFDNEEVGCISKQGAGSTFLYDTLSLICELLGISSTGYRSMISQSFLVSADNSHAKHPNHPELSDEKNSPFLNEGVVLKYNANQLYTTDGISAALFQEICRKSNVPLQIFANRSDIRGGSTLGNISNTQVSLNSVDIGAAQLAMHSAYETAGCQDVSFLFEASKAFFESKIIAQADGDYILS